MYKHRSLKSIAAALSLLLFVLSVTPKQLLHDVITGHRHTDMKYAGGIHWQSSQKSFQCNWHEQAVESPFIDQPGFQVPQPFTAYSAYISHYRCDRYSSTHFHSFLRGPPVCA